MKAASEVRSEEGFLRRLVRRLGLSSEAPAPDSASEPESSKPGPMSAAADHPMPHPRTKVAPDSPFAPPPEATQVPAPAPAMARTPDPPPPPTEWERADEELLEQRLDQLGERIDRRLKRFGGRVESALASRPDPSPDTELLAGSVRSLEDRIEALQQELVSERETAGGLQVQLAAERERSERADRARAVAREETSQYRRVLAAAIANEKYAIDLATQARRDLRERSLQLQKSVHARGTAEGRAHELQAHLGELKQSAQDAGGPLWRAVALFSVASVLGLVGLGQWTTFLGRKMGPGDANPVPSDGTLLGLGLGAFALAVPLFLIGRQALRSAAKGRG